MKKFKGKSIRLQDSPERLFRIEKTISLIKPHTRGAKNLDGEMQHIRIVKKKTDVARTNVKMPRKRGRGHCVSGQRQTVLHNSKIRIMRLDERPSACDESITHFK